MLDLNLDTSLSINWGARLTRWKLDCCFLTQGCKRSVRPTRIVASTMAVRSASSVTKRPGPKYHRTATNKSRTTKCLSRHPTKAPATGRPWFAACRQWFAACGQWFAACRQWFAAASAESVRPAGLQEVQRLQLDPEGREAHQAQKALEGQQVQEGLFQKMAVVVVQRHHMGLVVAVVGPVIAAQVVAVVVVVPVPSPEDGPQ